MITSSNRQLASSYFQTDYSFTHGSQRILIRPGEENRDLKEFLEKEGIKSWAYITAWNPHSVLMPEDFNRQQQEQLLEKVKKFMVHKGEGKGRKGDWPAEESFFIAGISREEALELGRFFRQNAILLSNEEGQAVLEFLFPQNL